MTRGRRRLVLGGLSRRRAARIAGAAAGSWVAAPPRRPRGRPRRAALRGRDGVVRARPHLRRRLRVLHGRRRRGVRLRRRPASRRVRAGGAETAALFRNESPTGGALRFARVDAPEVTLKGVIGAYPLDLDADGLTDLAMLRYGASTLLRGIGDCRFEPVSATFWASTRRTAGSRPSAPPGRAARRCRPWPSAGTWCRTTPATPPAAATTRSSGQTRRGPATPRRSRCRRATARCRSCSATGTAQADATCGSATTASTTSRPGAAVAGGAGRGAARVHRRRRLGEHADLGHGDRQPGPHGRRPARGLPDEPGRQQAPDAAHRGRPAHVPRHRRRARRHRRAAVRGRRGPPVDGLAPAVRGRQQRRLLGPVRVQGERLLDARLREPRPEQPADRPGRTGRSSKGPRRRAWSPSTGAVAPRWPTSTTTGCSTSCSPTSVRRSARGGTSARARRTRPPRWATGSGLRLSQPGGNRDAIGAVIEVQAGDAVQRRELVVGGGHAGGQLGWTHVGIGTATAAKVRVDVAGRRAGPVAGRDGERVRGHRARRERGGTVDAARGLIGERRTMATRATGHDRAARLRDARAPPRAAGRAIRGPGRGPRGRARMRAATTGSSCTPTASTARASRS